MPQWVCFLGLVNSRVLLFLPSVVSEMTISRANHAFTRDVAKQLIRGTLHVEFAGDQQILNLKKPLTVCLSAVCLK